jgi:hypothetical protein
MFGKYRGAVPVSNLLPIVVISCLSSLLNDRNRIPISYFIISISLTLSQGSFSKFSRGTDRGETTGGGGDSPVSISSGISTLFRQGNFENIQVSRIEN